MKSETIYDWEIVTDSESRVCVMLVIENGQYLYARLPYADDYSSALPTLELRKTLNWRPVPDSLLSHVRGDTDRRRVMQWLSFEICRRVVIEEAEEESAKYSVCHC